MPLRKKSSYWGKPKDAPTHPYVELEGTPVWNAVKKALTDLDRNQDLDLQEWHQYIVGYICKTLTKHKLIKEFAKQKEERDANPPEEGTELEPAETQVAFRNRSRMGWWLYREIEKFVPDGQKESGSKTGYDIWENTRLITAEDRDEAYAKAMSLGTKNSPNKTKGGAWHFVGISQLLPIYEELEDGAEVMWDQLGVLSQKEIDFLVKSKQRLSVFDDSDPR